MPLISIIIPIYNQEKYLNECLTSVVNQTYNEWECLLINDGSTDKSYEIANEWAKKDNRFIIYSQNNSGVSSARNKGINKANGEYLTFIDPDDWVTNDYLKKLYDNIIKYNSDFSCCGYMDVDLNKKIIPKQDKKNIPILYEAYNPNDILKLMGWRRATAKLFKKNVILQNNLRFREDLIVWEDSEFMTRLRFKSKKVSGIKEALYFVRHNPNSATRSESLNEKRKQSIAMARKLIKETEFEYGDNIKIKLTPYLWLNS